jgi:hypothetical protein
MSNSNFIPNAVSVTVNGMQYWIPSYKYQELLSLLESWKSLAVAQSQKSGISETSGFQGKQIINE